MRNNHKGHGMVAPLLVRLPALIALPLWDLNIPKSLPSQARAVPSMRLGAFADRRVVVGGLVRKAAREPQSKTTGGMEVCDHAVAHRSRVSPGWR